MSEDKYDKLLNAAIVLLIASAAVLGYSVYNSHFSKNDVKHNAIAVSNVKDSLKNVYTNTVSSIDTNLVRTNTETNPELEEKYREVDILRAEINKLLLSDGDGNLASAQQKIQELQQKISTLEIRYEDASLQNRKLKETLQELKDNNDPDVVGINPNTETNNRNTGIKPKTNTGSQTTNVTSSQSVNKTSEMAFYAVANGSANQTTKISNADKLQGSFLFKYKTPYTNDPLYIVVIQPDGKTVKGPSWDIGVFDSDEGKKVFTKKLAVDYNGEPQKLDFSVQPDDFMAGSYTMEIWYKKNLIGTIVRTLL